jgi:hypothetical protein
LYKNIIYITIFFIALIVPAKKVIAQKIDTIIHINGNVMTGDFKKMVYGVITWKMDGMGTISLEEPKVKTIISKKQFEIKMKSKRVYFGSFGASDKARTVYIITATDSILKTTDDIVEAYPIKRSFWMRTSGNFSLGLNYSKGSDITTFSFSGDLTYRKRNANYSLTWDDNFTYQGDTLNSSKADVDLSWERLLNKGWSTGLALTATQNLELGTKLRIGVSALGIKDIKYNNWNRFYVGAGFNVTQETPYDDSGKTDDIAGILTAVWKVYKYTSPKVWVDADISYLPYFTDSGRYRTVLNINPKVSIFSDDFKVGFNFYYNYDSKPTTTGASNDDYGINLQFTYSLH